MNDFIVWDKCRKVWIDESYPFFINSRGFLCIQRNDKQMVIENDCEIFKSLGLTDIKSKSIYADSSIVEFKMMINKEEVVIKGYFSYIEEELRHEFYQYFDQRQSFIKAFLSPRDSRITEKFKSIDTIQENKLGLIK